MVKIALLPRTTFVTGFDASKRRAAPYVVLYAEFLSYTQSINPFSFLFLLCFVFAPGNSPD